MVYICNGTLSSHKQNEILSCAAIWLELKVIMLSKINQTQKDKYMFSLICGNQYTEEWNGLEATRDLEEEGEWGTERSSLRDTKTKEFVLVVLWYSWLKQSMIYFRMNRRI